MKKLIIHADDFGLTEEINEGILTAVRNGAVSSASLLVNFPASQKAMELARSENLDVGWHLNLTQGRPVSPPETVPSLILRNGLFPPLRTLIRKSFLRTLNPQELETELTAQLKAFQDADISVSHLDGHQHVHVLPVVRDVLKKILMRRPIPFLRLPVEGGGIGRPRFAARWFLKNLKGSRKAFWRETGVRTIPFYGLSLGRYAGRLDAWKQLLQDIPEDAAEIMVHPGLPGGDGAAEDGYPGDRHEEWRLLVDPQLKQLLGKNGFQPVRFRDLI